MKQKSYKAILLLIILISLLFLCSCDTNENSSDSQPYNYTVDSQETVEITSEKPTEQPTEKQTEIATEKPTERESIPFDISIVPEYSGNPYITINDNKPYFDISKYSAESFESYTPLDNLGRCGVAFACVSKDIMPTEERGQIGMIKPSGWHIIKYDCVDGKYLYNRCHLLAYQLTGENANIENLITGTRALNVEGMQPFENKVANYVNNTNNHVLYRVTPIFVGNNLLASGVLMEGYSIEDMGDGIEFCVFAYNAQPQIKIDYTNGESELISTENSKSSSDSKESENTNDNPNSSTFILNTNTHKFHYPDCASVDDMAEHNKQEFTGNRDELIAQGYNPCKRCNP